MKAVIQRVKNCSVLVDGRTTGNLDHGLLIYLGIHHNDTEKEVRYIADKAVNLRIFNDQEGKMNLSLKDNPGSDLLVVSQFTLYGDARKGRRPSYSEAAGPEQAKTLYNAFIAYLQDLGYSPAQGEFQAVMEVTYTNIGPVTILLDTDK
jgi:D-tyrosyl-tRNA(Tyr) deacylase